MKNEICCLLLLNFQPKIDIPEMEFDLVGWIREEVVDGWHNLRGPATNILPQAML